VRAGAGLRDDPPLAEPPGEHGLAQRVVELVRARVQQILALQPEAPAGGEALAERQRRRAAAVRPAELVELRSEEGIFLRRQPPGLELLECRDERLGNEAAAVLAVPAVHRAASR